MDTQERLDRQYVRARLEHFKPKQWRQRLTRLLSDSVSAKFTQLLELAPQCGQPNLKVRAPRPPPPHNTSPRCGSHSLAPPTHRPPSPGPAAQPACGKQRRSGAPWGACACSRERVCALNGCLCTCVCLQIKYNQEGDVVLEEKRDYLGNLVGLKLLDKMTGQEELVSDATKLRTMEIIEEEVRLCCWETPAGMLPAFIGSRSQHRRVVVSNGRLKPPVVELLRADV